MGPEIEVSQMGSMGITWALLGVLIPLLGITFYLLQKRLKLFTKSTLTFMVVFLMVFTLFSVLDHLQDVKKTQSLVRDYPEKTLESILTNWLVDERGSVTAAVMVLPNDGFRDNVKSSLELLQAEIEEEMAKQGYQHRLVNRSQLVCLDIGHATTRFMGSGSIRKWRLPFDIVMDDGRNNYIHVKAHADLHFGQDRPIRVQKIAGEIAKYSSTHRRDREIARLFRNADTYRNSEYKRTRNRLVSFKK